METALQVPVAAAAVTVVPKLDVAAAEDPSLKYRTAPPEHPMPQLLMGAAGAAPERPTPQLLMGVAGAAPERPIPQLLMGAGPERSSPYCTGAYPPVMGGQPALGALQPGMQRVPIYPEPNVVEHLVCCCCLGM